MAEFECMAPWCGQRMDKWDYIKYTPERYPFSIESINKILEICIKEVEKKHE